MYGLMRKLVLLFKLSISLITPPYYSFFITTERLCKKEIEKRPNDIYSIWLLSYIYVQNDKYEEAQILLESLINRGIDRKAIKLLLSRVYFNLRQYEKVEKILSRFEKLTDKDTANYYIGYSLIELGKVDEGIKYLEIYLKHHPKDYMVLWKLGYEYFKHEQYNLALEAYRKAEKLNPSKKEIKDGIDLCIENLKNVSDVSSVH